MEKSRPIIVSLSRHTTARSNASFILTASTEGYYTNGNRFEVAKKGVKNGIRISVC